MIQNQKTPAITSLLSNALPKGQKLEWKHFPIGEINAKDCLGETVLLGHHLFVFAHGLQLGSYRKTKHWVIDLQNNRVEIPWEWWNYFGAAKQNYSLTKYGENKIVKFGGEMTGKVTNELVLITVDSFERKLLLKSISLIFTQL